MRKNSKNEKVIRAMAIGISAMLMASSPLTALAAEGEGNSSEGNEDKNITVTPEAGVCDQAEAAAEAAKGSVEDAENKATAVKSEVADQVVAGEVKDAQGKDLAQDVLDANAKVEDKAVEGGSPLKDAESAIENADTGLGVAEENDKLSDAELNKAADAATNAEQTAKEAKDAMQEAKDRVDGQIEGIKDASSVEEANAAYEEVRTTVDQAQADFDAKLAEYNTAKTAYEEAAQKVADYENAYKDAINSADANAEAAAAELAAAQANAEALAKALEAAKGAVDASAKGALVIADKEALTRGDNGLNWKNEDQLFISIMQNYYLPEECGIKGKTEVKRIQGEDNDTKNYFEVTYTDKDGNTQTKYYNYVMDDNQTSKDNIVIFEKRIEEVKWKEYQETNPDQYVKGNGDTISVSDVENGLNDGTIIAVDGNKVIKNDGTVSIIIADNNQKTETGEVDTIVDKDKQDESWKLDENGKLIKTVTADVTTITYTDAKFTSTDQYQTEADRKDAADKKKVELEKEANVKDVTVTGTTKTDYTYTGNGTYIPTFTKTVPVKDEEVEWKHTDKITDYGVKTEAEAVASVKKEQEKALENEIKEDDDLYLIPDSISSDLKVSGYTEDHWYDDSDFLISGTVSATYAKVTKKTVDQSTFGSLWNDIKALFGKGEATNKKLEDTARKAVEADGGIFVSANWDDWKFGKATIRYVAGVSVKTDEKSSAEEARNAVQDAALAQAKAGDDTVTGVYNVKTTDTDKIAHTSYSYEIDYLEKTGEKKEENKVVRTETYDKAEILTGQIIQNLNYYDKKILLTQNDEDYRQFVDDAKALTEKYQKLLGDAQDAQKDVETAQGKVEELKNEIEALKNDRTSNLAALEALEEKLTVAEQNKKDAEDTLNEILDSLDEAGGELDRVIERLTPTPAPATPAPATPAPATPAPATPAPATPAPAVPAPATPAPATPAPAQQENTPAASTDDNDNDNAETGNEGQSVAAPVVFTNAPVVQAASVTQNQAAAQGAVQIADEAAPLAANVAENGQGGATQTEVKEPEAAETVQIADEEVPLADVSVENEQAKMPWWWLLIVLVLGTAGYEMYKKHNEKKLKVQAENAEDVEE